MTSIATTNECGLSEERMADGLAILAKYCRNQHGMVAETDREQTERQKLSHKLQTVVKSIEFRCLVILMVLTLYIFLGAAVFYELEFEAEENRLNASNEHVRQQRDILINRLLEEFNKVTSNVVDETIGFVQNDTQNNRKETNQDAAGSILVSGSTLAPIENGFNETEAKQFALNKTENVIEDRGTVAEVNLFVNWYEGNLSITAHAPLPVYNFGDVYSLLFFCGTLLSTIGYGNIAPKTDFGQLVTLLYSFFGIPLMLITLKYWGELLFKYVEKLWHFSLKQSRKCYNSGRKKFRKMSNEDKIRENGSPRPTIVIEDDEEEDHKLINHIEDTVPLMFASLCTVAYITICALLTYAVEGPLLRNEQGQKGNSWNFVQTLYFIYISFSTIGLGDLVPTKPYFAAATFILMLIGLALLSMIINVVQSRIEARYMAALRLLETQAATQQQEAARSMQMASSIHEAVIDQLIAASHANGHIDKNLAKSISGTVTPILSDQRKISGNSNKQLSAAGKIVAAGSTPPALACLMTGKVALEEIKEEKEHCLKEEETSENMVNNMGFFQDVIDIQLRMNRETQYKINEDHTVNIELPGDNIDETSVPRTLNATDMGICLNKMLTVISVGEKETELVP